MIIAKRFTTQIIATNYLIRKCLGSAIQEKRSTLSLAMSAISSDCLFRVSHSVSPTLTTDVLTFYARSVQHAIHVILEHYVTCSRCSLASGALWKGKDKDVSSGFTARSHQADFTTLAPRSSP